MDDREKSGRILVVRNMGEALRMGLTTVPIIRPDIEPRPAPAPKVKVVARVHHQGNKEKERRRRQMERNRIKAEKRLQKAREE